MKKNWFQSLFNSQFSVLIHFEFIHKKWMLWTLNELKKQNMKWATNQNYDRSFHDLNRTKKKKQPNTNDLPSTSTFSVFVSLKRIIFTKLFNYSHNKELKTSKTNQLEMKRMKEVEEHDRSDKKNTNCAM